MLENNSKRVKLNATHSERDLGVLVDKELKFSLHCNTQVNKANRMLGMIRRTFVNLNSYIFKRVFIALVRPHLEYCGSAQNKRRSPVNVRQLLANVRQKCDFAGQFVRQVFSPRWEKLSYGPATILLYL